MTPHATEQRMIEIVRSLVGRRSRISRQEMADILAAMEAAGIAMANDCLYDTTLAAWADRCTGIECISVLASGTTPHGMVRYDQPGSMAPMHHAVVMFAAADIDPSTKDYLRRHTRRLLRVSGPPLRAEPEPAPAAIPGWIALARRADGVDGVWTRVLDDGTIELRDPNSGQGSDPRRKPRVQYRITDAGCERRHLPAECVGDVWEDIGVPEWEACDPPRSGPVWDWIEAQL